MNDIPVQQAVPTPKKSNKTMIVGIMVFLILCCICAITGAAAGYFGFQAINSGELIQLEYNSPSDENSVEATIAPQKKSSQTAPKPGKATQKPLIQVPNLSGVKLGDEVRFENCGFSFKKVPDFQYHNAEMDGWGFCGSPAMIAPGGDNEFGPIIMMIDEAGEDANFKYDQMQKQYKNNDNVISQETTKIGSVDGISVITETKSGNIILKSQIVFAMVSPNHFFQIIALANSEKWGELLPYYEAVVKSVSFFEPVQATAPSNKSGEEIRSEEGGYAFKTIPDYKVTINDFISGSIFMEPKDKVVVKIGAKDGPNISLFGQSIKADISFDQYVKSANDSMILNDKATISDEQDITIAGKTGKAFDYDYEIAAIGKIKARVIFLEVNPKQFFMVSCFSPENKWNKTLADFKAVTDSVTFFDAKPKK